MKRPEIEIDVNDEFARMVLDGVADSPPSQPRVFYNQDGDCIELLLSDEGYYMERIDKLVTVYYGRESGAIVGGLFNGVKRFVREILAQHPGFAVVS